MNNGYGRTQAGFSLMVIAFVWTFGMSIAAEGVEASKTVPQPPLRITVTEAVLQSLENNRALKVQRLDPLRQQTFEEDEKAVFDPVLEGQLSAERVEGERLARSGSQTEAYTTDTVEGRIALETFFPSGTTLTLEAESQMEDSSLYDERFYENRLGLTVNQALLQGAGTQSNLARLRQARLDTRMSEFELRGFSQTLVADVESAYWDYALALRQIEIVQASLDVSRQQLAETRELIDVGRLPRAELAAVQAEVATEEQALIEAQANRETIHLKLLRLINPPGPAPWEREIQLVHRPTLPDIVLAPVSAHVAVARKMRPELNQARLEILRGDLEVVKTRDGLLPRLDLFVTLGKSGYASAFGASFENFGKDRYDAQVGIEFEMPVRRRSAQAHYRRATLDRSQAEAALANLTQLVEMDVRSAYIEVNRTKQQIAASAATRTFNEEKTRIEKEKLRVGKSTSFLVAQAQRDLLASRIAEVRAIVNYLKALVSLYRLDGSLLDRHRIDSPGKTPVDLPDSAKDLQFDSQLAN